MHPAFWFSEAEETLATCCGRNAGMLVRFARGLYEYTRGWTREGGIGCQRTFASFDGYYVMQRALRGLMIDV